MKVLYRTEQGFIDEEGNETIGFCFVKQKPLLFNPFLLSFVTICGRFRKGKFGFRSEEAGYIEIRCPALRSPLPWAIGPFHLSLD